MLAKLVYSTEMLFSHTSVALNAFHLFLFFLRFFKLPVLHCARYYLICYISYPFFFSSNIILFDQLCLHHGIRVRSTATASFFLQHPSRRKVPCKPSWQETERARIPKPIYQSDFFRDAVQSIKKQTASSRSWFYLHL